MGAASSSGSWQLTQPQNEGKGPWSLPPACQDDVWGSIDLSTLVGTGAGLAGKGGGDFSHMSSERLREGMAGESQPPRPSQFGSSPEGLSEEEDDWLAASLCLSMSALRREEMVLVVSRVKSKLFKTLSCLCSQDDPFCRAVTQRLHVLHCVHAAMSRQRRAQFTGNRGDPAAEPPHHVVAEESTGDVSSAASGDDLLGLQLFFSMLDFVRDPECGQEQLTDFLRQISPVLTKLPPLCLADGCSGLPKHLHERIPGPSAGVVDSVRGFLAMLALPGQFNYDISHAKGERDHCSGGEAGASGGEAGASGAERRHGALSSMIGLVAARGRASDLLTLVKLLLSIPFQKVEGVEMLNDESKYKHLPGATELREEHAVAECSAKR